MDGPLGARAIAAAEAIASSLALTCDQAVVLNNSNKLTLRLLPCDVLARVAPTPDNVAQREVELARRLAEAGCPVGILEPRVSPAVHERDGFAVTLWAYYEQVRAGQLSPSTYARALEALHTGMRGISAPVPHFTTRVESAVQLVADHSRTPALPARDRELLARVLERVGGSVVERSGDEQLLHGEPHPGNVLSTPDGPLFIDLETCCRGPLEFDVAHAPVEVGEYYRGIDPELLRDCRILVLAMITTWRWDRNDQLPNGRALAAQWLGELRAALGGKI